jgi:hypothetical protein
MYISGDRPHGVVILVENPKKARALTEAMEKASSLDTTAEYFIEYYEEKKDKGVYYYAGDNSEDQMKYVVDGIMKNLTRLDVFFTVVLDDGYHRAPSEAMGYVTNGAWRALAHISDTYAQKDKYELVIYKSNPIVHGDLYKSMTATMLKKFNRVVELTDKGEWMVKHTTA